MRMHDTNTSANTRVMALDIGDRTCGIALSDPLWITAQPLTTLRYTGPHERKKIFTQLSTLLADQQVGTVVIGLPLNMNGGEGPQAAKVRDFVAAWRKFLARRQQDATTGATAPAEPEWIFWDERLSTAGAERHLIAADVSRAKRRKIIDTMAAVFILQGFLASDTLDSPF
jgi:putative Holliday junction resolvase